MSIHKSITAVATGRGGGWGLLMSDRFRHGGCLILPLMSSRFASTWPLSVGDLIGTVKRTGVANTSPGGLSGNSLSPKNCFTAGCFIGMTN